MKENRLIPCDRCGNTTSSSEITPNGMTDNVNSSKARGFRVAQVIADARYVVNGGVIDDDSKVPTPSLDSPTRPKTPASFDDRMANASLNITLMKAKSNSRLSGSTALFRQKLDSIENAKPKNLNNQKVTSERKSATGLTRIPDCGFNTSLLLQDLEEVESKIGSESSSQVAGMTAGLCDRLMGFLQSMKSDTEIDSGMIGQIEESLMKFSGIALNLLGAPTLDVLTALRQNLRILNALIKNSVKGGQFDLELVGGVLKQCAQALFQTCQDCVVWDTAGEKTVQFAAAGISAVSTLAATGSAKQGGQDNVYQSLDECDIEYEGEDGHFVSAQQATWAANTTTSTTAPTTSATTAVTGLGSNCELAGAAQLLSILDLSWKAIYYQIKLHNSAAEDPQNAQTIEYLVEAAVVIVATLTLLSADKTDCKWLERAAALEVLGNGLKLFNSSTVQSYIRSALAKARADKGGHSDNDSCWVSCVVQLLSLLRSFSIVCRKQVTERNFTKLLCGLLQSYKRHPAVVVNCARVLAKLSPTKEGRDQINADPTHIACLAEVVVHEANQMGGTGTAATSGGGGGDGHESDEEGEEAVWPGEHTWAILTRVCFTLGNLTTTNAENRQLIGQKLGLADHLVMLLQACAASLESITNASAADHTDKHTSDHDDEDGSFAQFDDNDSSGSDGDVEGDKGRTADDEGNEEGSRSSEREFLDATIKMVRLLANLCIDPEIGAAMGARLDVTQMLWKLLENAVQDHRGVVYEELLLNVIAACTNVTYFSCQFINKSLPSGPSGSAGRASQSMGKVALTAARMLDISRLMLARLSDSCLHHQNSEVSLESARVLGNLTRTAEIREELVLQGADEALVKLLKRDEWEIVAAVAGVLVNLSADVRCREALLRPSLGLLRAFFWTLNKVGLEYIELSTLICQALYNLLLGQGAGDQAALGTLPDRIRSKLTELMESATAPQMDEMSPAESKQIGSFVKVATAVVRLLSGLGMGRPSTATQSALSSDAL